MWTKKIVREDIAELKREKYGNQFSDIPYINEVMVEKAGKVIIVKELGEETKKYTHTCKEGWSWIDEWFEDGLKSKSEVI